MSGGRRRTVVVGVATLATLLVVACDVLVLLHHEHGWSGGFPVWLEGSLSLPIWLVIGLLVTFRVPGNVLGPMAVTYGLLDGLQLFSGALATYLIGAHSAPTLAKVLVSTSLLTQAAVIAGLLLFAQLVPDGRLVSRRWWPFVAVTLAATLVAGLTSLGSASDVHDSVPAAQVVVSGVSDARLHAMFLVANVLILVGLAGALAGIAVRWRRGDEVQRQQLKLVFFAAVTAVFLVVVVQPVGDALFPHARLAGSLLWTIIAAILPASLAAAVLRYRLYDIDRIVSRTVSYAAVTGGVVGIYVGAVALIESVLGYSSAVAVAASTLAAAAAFQPLRRRVQHAVDRRFDRAAYDARRTIDRFSVSLRDQVDVDAVRDDLLTTVSLSVAPSSASLWLANP